MPDINTDCLTPASLPANMRSKTEDTGTCWNWTGALQTRGYGSVGISDGRTSLAHRRSYELLVGPIPEGLTIDHLCFNKRCINPAHLEPVTGAENTRRSLARQTHCKSGHPLFGENLRIQVRNGNAHRICLTCSREYKREYMRKVNGGLGRAAGRKAA